VPNSETPDQRTLPVFPLGSVLVPGLVMPLHIFEPRYRQLVEDLLTLPEEERDFVIVAIRDGHEVGAAGIRTLHQVGTVASLREVDPHDDGRFDIVTVGTDRVHIDEVIDDSPYLRATVSTLPEDPGDAAEFVAQQVRQAFARYRGSLAGDADDDEGSDLPDDPGVLSYLVAAAMVVDLADRQAFLEVPTDTQRLRQQLRTLRREAALIAAIPSLPAVDLRSASVSLN
jgi:Lon protease-like protein